jgi:hypothetical protein
MAKKPANAGKLWTAAHDAQLRREAAQNTPTRALGLQLDRTETPCAAGLASWVSR